MDLTLRRTSATKFGIFGQLETLDEGVFCYTLEHAYLQEDGTFKPKVPVGTYTCEKGQHQLESMKTPFTAFEVKNVPEHTNILIHMGNYNQDSEGCILVGKLPDLSERGRMIANSKDMFANFMKLQIPVSTFQLVVIESYKI